jgi:hypothetical protein
VGGPTSDRDLGEAATNDAAGRVTERGGRCHAAWVGEAASQVGPRCQRRMETMLSGPGSGWAPVTQSAREVPDSWAG